MPHRGRLHRRDSGSARRRGDSVENRGRRTADDGAFSAAGGSSAELNQAGSGRPVWVDTGEGHGVPCPYRDVAARLASRDPAITQPTFLACPLSWYLALAKKPSPQPPPRGYPALA